MMTQNILLYIDFGFPFVLMLFFAGVFPLVLMLWALIDLLRSDFKNSTEKLIWAVVVIFVPMLGAILYLVIGRSHKVRPPHPFHQNPDRL